MKNIILHLDKEFFEKLKADKLKKQAEFGKEMTWEVYIAVLFGASKFKLKMK